MYIARTYLSCYKLNILRHILICVYRHTRLRINIDNMCICIYTQSSAKEQEGKKGNHRVISLAEGGLWLVNYNILHY